MNFPSKKLLPELQAFERTLTKSPLEKINDPFLENHDIQLWAKRDDLIHPIISGNKWRKLKYNLNHALIQGADTLVSMGGAYSNHLHALAYAGQQLKLKTIGIIRGERRDVLTPTLQDMADWGMELRFVSRSEYRQYRQYKRSGDVPGIESGQYWLPEGGSSRLAQQGISELAAEIDIPYEVICAPCGTGATLAGLINAVSEHVSVLGFSALKNAGYLDKEITAQLDNKNTINWHLIKDYHFGGFAKINSNLIAFIQKFEEKFLIPLEPVYTAKMFYGIYDLAAKGYFRPGSKIVAIHTGGIQGKRGYR